MITDLNHYVEEMEELTKILVMQKKLVLKLLTGENVLIAKVVPENTNQFVLMMLEHI